MGRSLSWLVIDSPDAEGIAAELGVKRTGKSGAINDFTLMAWPLPDGRVLLVSNHFDEPLFSDKRLTLLSKRGPIVVARMEEHVMGSSCAAWTGGRKIWSVKHDSEKGLRHLTASGKMPAEFAPLRQAALEAQDLEDKTHAEVDHVFDVPVQLARMQTGLDVEQDFGIAENSFLELNVGFWKRAWRATFLWRWILCFFGGLYLIGWIFRKLGWQ